MEEGAEQAAVHSKVHVRIFQDDVGGFPAQFQRHLLDSVRAHLHDIFSHLGAPGKCDLVDLRAPAQSLSHLASRSGYNIYHALGDFAFSDHLGYNECADGGIGGRFQNNGIAHGDGMENLPHGHTKGKVPGDDAHTHPDRLPADVISPGTCQ